MKKILSIIGLSLSLILVKSQTPSYWIPFSTGAPQLMATNYPENSNPDSLVVLSGGKWLGRVSSNTFVRNANLTSLLSAKQNNLTLTTTGTGAATLVGSTLNIPTFSNAVNSVFGRSGTIIANSGDYNTSLVTENTNLYFTQARVLATPLTGVITTNTSSILATDNILAAIGKLQAQATLNTYVINTTITVGQSKSQLNTLYPTAPINYTVLCPNIALGGAMYIKVTSGSNGDWQIISAPKLP